jgi:hypothetical protein
MLIVATRVSRAAIAAITLESRPSGKQESTSGVGDEMLTYDVRKRGVQIVDRLIEGMRVRHSAGQRAANRRRELEYGRDDLHRVPRTQFRDAGE